MKFISERSAILPALARADRASQSKSTMPVLKMVHLVAADSSLRVAATNLELSASSMVAAVVLSPGGCGADARGLLDRVKLMPDTAITFSLDPEGKLTLTAPGTSRRYTVRTVPADDLPIIEFAPAKALCSYPAALFSKRLSAVLPAVSFDTTRLQLNSVLLETSRDDFFLVSTDGHRMHLAGLGDARDTKPLLILRAGAEALASFLDELDDDAKIDICTSKVNLFFRTESVTLGVKQVDAQFPPWNQVVPSEESFTAHADVSRAALLAAIKVVSVVSDRVRVTVKDVFLELSTESVDGDSSLESISAAVTGTPGLWLVLQSSYLREAVASTVGDRVRIAFGDHLSPIRVRSDNDVTAIVMPQGR